MGFRSGAWARVWSVEPVTDTKTKIRLSISRKDKESGEYREEFSGYVNFYGTATAKRAAKLGERTTIKLGDVDVKNHYDRETKKGWTDYQVFTFECDGEDAPKKKAKEVDSGEVEAAEERDERLPF